MLCEPTLKSNEYNNPWKSKINTNPKYSGAPTPSSSLQSTSDKYSNSGATIVPDILSDKTSGSSDANSITPDKDHDVIMDEVDDVGGAAAGSGVGGSGEEGVNGESSEDRGVAVEAAAVEAEAVKKESDGEEDDSGAEDASAPAGEKKESDGDDSAYSDNDDGDSSEGDKDENLDKDVKMEEGTDEDDKDEEMEDVKKEEDSDDSGDEGSSAAADKGDSSKEKSDASEKSVKAEMEVDEASKNNDDGDEAPKKSSNGSDKNDDDGEEKKPSNEEHTNGNGKSSDPDNHAPKKEDDSSDNKKKEQAESDSKKEGEESKEKEPVSPTVNLPHLVGTLAYSDRDNLRRHIIRGNWKYENSHVTPPQPFELIRIIPEDEDLKELPKGGEFNGSFNVQHAVKTSKGKMKMKNHTIQETGVKLTFEKIVGEEGDDEVYNVNGQGTNAYGVFKLFGTATKNEGEAGSGEDDAPTYSVSVHKDYIAPPPPPPEGAAAPKDGKSKDKKRKHEGDLDDNAKPAPTVLPEGGVCLLGKLVRNTSDELSLDSAVVHRITGHWSMGGQAKIKEDPDQCEKFEYEHKTTGDSTGFPLSGRYIGGFYVFEHGVRTKVPEKDVTLKFKLNTEDYWNVEGKGSNNFGRYNYVGTLLKDGTITLYKLFHEVKPKTSKKAHVKISAPKAAGANGSSLISPKAAAPTNHLTFDDVNTPPEGEVPPQLTPPEQFTALSRGVLKIEHDGTHTCSGNWAMSNDHFQSGLTSKYHFGIEAHSAAKDAEVMLAAMKEKGLDKDDDREIKDLPVDDLKPDSLANSVFPINSTQYKGSFKLRKGATRTQTIYDNQIVLKYVKNSAGSYNVYGKGTNEMGTFDLVGTLLIQGKRGSGFMQLYRLYPPTPELPPVAQRPIGGMSRKSAKVFQGGLTEKATKENSGPAPAMKPPERFIPSMSGLQRRESSRMSRLPSRLEEDNPQAEMDRYMEKCGQIVKELMDIDVQKIFCAPVDPIALGIPQYPDIIKEPMDLGTIKTKLDNNEIDTPEEFKRLVNLTFMNAITFNNMPDNPVHLMARDFMTRFNNKFGSIDKAYNAAKKNKKLTKAERQELRKKEKEAAKEAKRKVKEEKERKRKAEVEAANESKRMKLENVVAANKSTMAAIAQAAPSDPDANMTRTEYNLLINAIKQVQEQIVGLHKLIKKTKSTSSSGSANKKTTSDAPSAFGAASSFAYAETAETHSSSKPKKKKAKKEEEEYQPKFESPPSSPSPKTYPKRAPVEEEDLQPLTFEEQEALSESINLLPERLLPGAMQIIRESEFVNDDDDEIDLDIDQLDTKTQRKLQKFVMEVSLTAPDGCLCVFVKYY
jgi:hypothetical protein